MDLRARMPRMDTSTGTGTVRLAELSSVTPHPDSHTTMRSRPSSHPLLSLTWRGVRSSDNIKLLFLTPRKV